MSFDLIPRALAYGVGATRLFADMPITVSGRHFACGDVPWRWRGATAFSLVCQVAQGREADAVAFLDWAASLRFNLVRTLTTAKNTFLDLTPEAGRTALPTLLNLARTRGLYVEVVGLSDTAERDFNWAQHARLTAEICASHPNALYEYANEPGHGTHLSILHDMNMVDRFARAATDGLAVVWSAGTGFDDESVVPTGRYAVRHLDRGRDLINQVRRVRELLSVSELTGVPVSNDEPLGAAEPGTSGQRCWEPWFFYAMGALESLFGVAGTFHFQDGLATVIPGVTQQACAEAYLKGTHIMPDEHQGRWSYRNSRHTGSPVVQIQPEEADPAENTPGGGPTVRAYSAISGAGEAVTVVLQRPDVYVPAGVTFGNGYQVTTVTQAYPHVTIVHSKN